MVTDLLDLETERLYNEFVTEREKLIGPKPIKRDKPARRYITLLQTEDETEECEE